LFTGYRLALKLSLAHIRALPTNGDRSQQQRTEARDLFDSGDCPVLVATDNVARGLNLQGARLVVNYDLPQDFNVSFLLFKKYN
jgi:superfamily II DNA/RNA helicase